MKPTAGSALQNAVVAAGVALAFAACGGGAGGPSSPVQPSAVTAPTPTPPAVPVVRDGWTEQTVVAEVTPAAPAPGDRIVARGTGFLTREQFFDGTAIFLWPGEQTYVGALAYHPFTDGTQRTVRWTSPSLTVTLDGDLADDPPILAKTEEVVAEVRRATGFPVSVGTGGACVISVDPSIQEDDAVGQARLTFRGATITAARVTFARRSEIAGGTRADYRNTLLHELGHVMGLGHSPSTRDVMTPAEGPGTKEAQFQPGEATCLRMLYAHRRAGNLFPDRDVALGAALSERTWTAVIRD